MLDGMIFISGLIMGSFLNVCIYRIPRNQSVVFPPSHCGSCDRHLSPWELIPILSYLFLRGRCRTCQARISFRYPLVELLTGITYLLLYLKYGLSISFLAAVFLMTVLIIIFFIDYDYMIIPDKLVVIALLGAVLTAAGNFFWPIEMYGDRTWWNPLLGAVLGSGLLLLVSLAASLIFQTDEAMGGGDIKILFPIGMFLGWKLVLLSMFIAILLAGFSAALLLILGRTSRKAMIPFGPFIVMGTFLSLLWGQQILTWYWTLLLY